MSGEGARIYGQLQMCGEEKNEGEKINPASGPLYIWSWLTGLKRKPYQCPATWYLAVTQS